MTPQPRVYISILNWNGSARTLDCLSSLMKLDYDNKKIIVVDNASTDQSVAQISAHFPDVELIRSESNVGYAAGNLLAARRALEDDADLFWIVNNDCVVEPDSLQALVDAHQKYGKGLYGSVSFTQGDWQTNPQTAPLIILSWELNARGKPDYGKLMFLKPFSAYFADQDVLEVANLVGNSLLIPVDVIREHGFIDTSFFLYWEETDYCFRLRKAGIPSYVVASSRVFHQPGMAHKHDQRLKPVVTYYNVRNRLLWSRRHRAPLDHVRVVLMNMGFTVLRLGAILKSGPSALVVVQYAARAIIDGIFNRSGKTIAPEDFVDANYTKP